MTNNRPMTPAPTRRLLAAAAAALVVLVAAGCASSSADQPAASAGPVTSAAAASPGSSPSPAGSLPTGLATPDPNLPADWPVAIPGYQDGRLLSAVVSPDGKNVNGAWASDATPEDAWAGMEARLRSLGYVTAAESGADDQLVSDETQHSDLFVRDGYEVNLVVIPGKQTTVMVNGSAL